MRILKILGTGLLPVLFFCQQATAQTNAECYECHGEQDLTTEDEQGNERSLFTDENIFSTSIHGEFECIDCHADISEVPHEDRLEKVDCGICHEDAIDELERSVHGAALRAKSSDVPTCATCHGTHDILAKDNPESKISHRNQPQTCGQCHANPDVIARNKFALKNAVALYEKSIHGELSAADNGKAATCSDCHGGHLTLFALDQQSSIYKLNISKTCGKCHTEEQQEYAISIHATSLLEGAKDSPVCNDCHGEHDVLRPENPKSRTSGFNVATEVCSPCHASERLAAKYGLTTARVETYKDSYHGLASRGGKAAVANCGSCHGVHDILPSTDPRSPINEANLVTTCGQCHPSATTNFTRGKVHLVEGERETKIIGFVRMIYISLIVVVIGFMVIHNGIDWFAKIRHIRLGKYHAKK